MRKKTYGLESENQPKNVHQVWRKEEKTQENVQHKRNVSVATTPFIPTSIRLFFTLPAYTSWYLFSPQTVYFVFFLSQLVSFHYISV